MSVSYSQRYRQNRYERGICYRCNNPRRPESSGCQQCADSDKQRFDNQVAAGLCRQCRKPREFLDNVKCVNCNINVRLKRLERLGLPKSEVERARVAINIHEGVCESCGVSDPGGRGEWNLDHDQKFKLFRGILCCGCNSAIGHAGESIERLEAAAVYLKEKQR